MQVYRVSQERQVQLGLQALKDWMVFQGPKDQEAYQDHKEFEEILDHKGYQDLLVHKVLQEPVQSVRPTVSWL